MNWEENMTISAQNAVSSPPEINYALLGENLLSLAQAWEELTEVLNAEIEVYGSIAGFSRFSKVNNASISKFLNKEATLGGEQTLENLSKACSSKYPELDSILLRIFEYKDKCGNRLGPLTLCRPGVINLWSMLMDKSQKLKISKNVIAAQFRGYENVIAGILTTKPPLHCLKKMETDFNEIYPVLANLDWENMKSAFEFAPSKSLPARPRLKHNSSHVAVTSHVADTHTAVNSAQAKFVQIADQCFQKYQTKQAILTACKQKGIPIGRTSFRLAYRRGKIGPAARKFIKLAPRLLLNQVSGPEAGAPFKVVEPPDKQISKPQSAAQLLVSVEDYAPHDRNIAESEIFNMALRAQLRSTIAFLNEAIGASAVQREKIVAKFQLEIDELISGLHALSARNPKDILGMLIPHRAPVVKPTGRRNRGTRKKL